MTKFVVLATAAAAALGALAPASESSPAQPSADAAKFVSKRYGYSIELGPGWKATFARKNWTGGFPLMDSGEVDFFTDPTGELFFIVGATRLPAGTTLRKWERSHAKVMSTGVGFCQQARAFRSSQLGGVRGREFLGRCPVHDAIVVVAIHRGRGYTFQFVSPRANTLASDRALFSPVKRSFRFTS